MLCGLTDPAVQGFVIGRTRNSSTWSALVVRVDDSQAEQANNPSKLNKPSTPKANAHAEADETGQARVRRAEG